MSISGSYSPINDMLQVANYELNMAEQSLEKTSGSKDLKKVDKLLTQVKNKMNQVKTELRTETKFKGDVKTLKTQLKQLEKAVDRVSKQHQKTETAQKKEGVKTLLKTAQKEVDKMASTLAKSQAGVTPKKMDKFTSDFKQTLDQVKNELTSGGKEVVQSKTTQEHFQKLEKSVTKLIHHQQSQQQPPSQRGQTVNYGNVLMGLWKKLKTVKKEVIPPKKRMMVEKVEETTFLTSTEKEFKNFVKRIRLKKKRSPTEKFLLEFIKELIKKAEELKVFIQSRKKIRHGHSVNVQSFDEIYHCIDIIQNDTEFKQTLTKIGTRGKTGNLHLRLWKIVKEFKANLDKYQKLVK